MTDKILLKTVIVSSFITGLILGFIPLIPILLWLGILALMFLVSPFIIIYLKNSGMIKEFENDKILMISAVSGVSAVPGFCIVYFFFGLLLQLLFKIQAFIWIKVLFVNFGFIIPMVFFTMLLCAMLNAFSGFVTVYFYNIFNAKNRG